MEELGCVRVVFVVVSSSFGCGRGSLRCVDQHSTFVVVVVAVLVTLATVLLCVAALAAGLLV